MKLWKEVTFKENRSIYQDSKKNSHRTQSCLCSMRWGKEDFNFWNLQTNSNVESDISKRDVGCWCYLHSSYLPLIILERGLSQRLVFTVYYYKNLTSPSFYIDHLFPSHHFSSKKRWIFSHILLSFLSVYLHFIAVFLGERHVPPSPQSFHLTQSNTSSSSPTTFHGEMKSLRTTISPQLMTLCGLICAQKTWTVIERSSVGTCSIAGSRILEVQENWNSSGISLRKTCSWTLIHCMGRPSWRIWSTCWCWMWIVWCGAFERRPGLRRLENHMEAGRIRLFSSGVIL